jgi:hypothetical protein
LILTHSTSLRDLGFVLGMREKIEIGVSVHVDEAGTEDMPLGVDLPSARGRQVPSDLCNAPFRDQDVRDEWRCTLVAGYDGRGEEEDGRGRAVERHVVEAGGEAQQDLDK